MTPKDILTNPYFCPMPWTGLMYNFDGKVKNCIRSDAKTGELGNIKDTPIEKILLGTKNITQEKFKQMTKYEGRTNQDTRDAGMIALIYKDY